MIKLDHSQGSPHIPSLFTITLRTMQCLSLGVWDFPCVCHIRIGICASYAFLALESLSFVVCLLCLCVVCVSDV